MYRPRCAPELGSGTITKGEPWYQAIRLLPDGAEDEDRRLELLVARATCWRSGQADTGTQIAPMVCLLGQLPEHAAGRRLTLARAPALHIWAHAAPPRRGGKKVRCGEGGSGTDRMSLACHFHSPVP